MELELSPLYEQEIELKQERSSLDKEYEKEKIGEGTLQIIATEPVSLVYDKIFRVMQEYKDMKAMVGVSYNCVPGSKEMISVKEAQKLKAEAGRSAIHLFGMKCVIMAMMKLQCIHGLQR